MPIELDHTLGAAQHDRRDWRDRHDRALGSILAAACGDALGASYEFQPPALEGPVDMRASGRWKRGEWTDDTSMTIPVLEALARDSGTDESGSDPRSAAVLGHAARRWVGWSLWAPDIGHTTSVALWSVADTYDIEQGADHGGASDAQIAAACTRAAERHVANASREAGPGVTWSGNGSLMRTHALALAYLDPDPTEGDEGDEAQLAELAQAARSLSALTHADHDSRDACVLLTLAVRHAIITGTSDLRVGLPALDADRRTVWERRIAQAEGKHPSEIAMNSWSVGALQAAWAAITYERDRERERPRQRVDSSSAQPHPEPQAESASSSPPLSSSPPSSSLLARTLETAVRAGNDTDTVASIAGALAGATYGLSALPRAWTDDIFGWPGLRAAGLRDLAERAIAVQGKRLQRQRQQQGQGQGLTGGEGGDSGVRVGGGVGADMGRGVHQGKGDKSHDDETRSDVPDISDQPAWSDPPPAYQA